MTAHGRALLRPGMSGPAVRRVQDRLFRLGFAAMDADEYADMCFGAWTERAVRAFQDAYGMRVSGQVDEATWTMMFDDEPEARPTADRLLQLCLRQVDSPGPSPADCAELIAWACEQLGVLGVPSQSAPLWEWCTRYGLRVDAVAGAHLRGAVLYRAPGTVALSLGNGYSAVEAAGDGYAVRAGFRPFDHAALLPGIEYPE